MNLIGVDERFLGKETMIGLGIGFVFLFLNYFVPKFSLVLGVPDVPYSLGDFGKFMVIVIIAPIMEELLFRGVLTHFLSVLTKPFVAIVLQGLLFGVFHYTAYGSFSGMNVAFVGAALFGIGIGWLSVRLNNLFPGIIIHAMVNLSLWLKANVV